MELVNLARAYYSSIKCIHLQSDAAVECDLNWIAVVRGLHECREVTDADLFQRGLAPAR